MKKVQITGLIMAVIMASCASTDSSRSAKENADSGAHNTEYTKVEEGEAMEEAIAGAKDVDAIQENFNTESYDYIEENKFMSVLDEPLSTFSIDVDNASYSNMRRFLENGSLPPKDAIRIEELVNYFNYDYPVPESKDVPFSIHTEASESPWNKDNLLLHVGLQGYTIPTEQLPPSNLVFLIDVSGSMDSPNKLDLLKKSFKQLTGKLSSEDRVSIVVYAGSSGVVLEPTSGADKQKLFRAINRLNAGGSTAGAEGLELAYKVAEENLMTNGNNRIILATDGDFNVGQSSNAQMRRLIESKRDKGIYITVLGFGMGNYKDSRMEIIADHGNGNYFYIDDISESRKVLVDNLAGTLFTIAKDVKIQVEFNPEVVQSYRLIGYENRVMDAQDFADDKKDAGELGAGHSVTAIYELVPGKGVQNIPLKYQQTSVTSGSKDEIGTIKFRYKLPDENTSKLIVQAIPNQRANSEETSNDFRFSAAVASFGMVLKDSKFKGDANYDSVLTLARSGMGSDPYGLRSEFIGLVKLARDLQEVTMIEEEANR